MSCSGEAQGGQKGQEQEGQWQTLCLLFPEPDSAVRPCSYLSQVLLVIPKLGNCKTNLYNCRHILCTCTRNKELLAVLAWRESTPELTIEGFLFGRITMQVMGNSLSHKPLVFISHEMWAVKWKLLAGLWIVISSQRQYRNAQGKQVLNNLIKNLSYIPSYILRVLKIGTIVTLKT